MATIKEIAQLAGVSRGTVDRVLNHRGGVNAKTEEKIMRIIDATGYEPNLAGSMLAAQKKNIKLGVILLGVGTPFYDDVLSGIHEKAAELEQYNCSVLIRHTNYSLEEQLEAIDDLVAQGIHGLAISPYNDRLIRRKIDDLFELHIPVVTLNTDIENSKRIAYVGGNYHKSGATAAGLMSLAASCYPNIYVGIVSGSRDILCHTARIQGFQEVIKASYPNIHISASIVNQDDDFESYELTKRLLKEHPEINSLFFTAGGVYGGCRAVVSSGRAYDIKIITYDCVPTTKELLEKGIINATICQKPELQGSKPLEILFQYLVMGKEPANEYDYVELDIKIRESFIN